MFPQNAYFAIEPIRSYDAPMQSPLRMLGSVLLVALATAAVSCKKDSEPTPSAAPSASSPPSSPEVSLLPTPGAGGSSVKQHPVAVVWDDPSEWSKTPPRGGMRRATYKVPSAKGDLSMGEVAVFYFGPGQGGSVEENAARWAKQFGIEKGEVKRSNRRVNDLDQYIVEIPKGKYKPDMMNKNKEGFKEWAMLVAIVEAPSGSYFFKLTGPSKTVDQARPIFFKMLDTVKTAP